MKRPKIEKLDRTTREYLKQMLARYPKTKQSLAADRQSLMPSSTPNYEATPVSSGGENRPTEGLAIRIMSEESFIIREWEINAVESTLAVLDKTDIKIISMYFWQNPPETFESAAELLHMTSVGVKYHVDYIIDLLAFYYGVGVPK